MHKKDTMIDKIEQLETYPQAARVIALYLDEFCDRDQDYVNMIANAARKASEEIDRLREIITKTEEWVADCPEMCVY